MLKSLPFRSAIALSLFLLLTPMQNAVAQFYTTGEIYGYEADTLTYTELNINPVSTAQIERDGFIYLIDPTLGLLRFDGSVVDQVGYKVDGIPDFVPPLNCFHISSTGEFHAVDREGNYLRFFEDGECLRTTDRRIAKTKQIAEAADGSIWFFGDSVCYREGEEIIYSGIALSDPFQGYVFRDSFAFFYYDDYDLWDWEDNGVEATVVRIDLLNRSSEVFGFDYKMIYESFGALNSHTILYADEFDLRLSSLDLLSREKKTLFDSELFGWNTQVLMNPEGSAYLDNGGDGVYKLQMDTVLQLSKIASGVFFGSLLVDSYDQVWNFGPKMVQISRKSLFHLSQLPVKPCKEPVNGLRPGVGNQDYQLFFDSHNSIWYHGSNNKLMRYNYVEDLTEMYDLSPYDDRTVYMEDGDYLYRYPYCETHLYYGYSYNMINWMLEGEDGDLYFGHGNRVLQFDDEGKQLEALFELGDREDEVLAVGQIAGGDFLVVSRMALNRFSNGTIWSNQEIEQSARDADTTICDAKVIDFRIHGEVAVIRYVHSLVITSLADGHVIEYLPTNLVDMEYDMAELETYGQEYLVTSLRDSLLLISRDGAISYKKALPGSKKNMKTSLTSADEMLWVVTPDRFYKYNFQTEEAELLDRYRVDKSRKCMVTNDQLWVMAPNEVTRMDQSGIFSTLYKDPDRQLYSIAYGVSDSIAAATTNMEVFWFNLNDFRQESSGKSLVKSFRFNEQTIPLLRLQADDEISMRYDQNSLSFEILSADLAATAYQNRYYIPGVDQSWNLSQGPAVDQYRDLKPGKYTLHYQSEDIYGNWNEISQIDFRIRPPWWKTRVAYIVYVLSILALFISILRVRESYLRKEKVRLQTLVDERTVEIKNQMEEIEAQRDEIEAQRDLVQDQKDLILVQKQDLTDSIDYAVRIQESLLPDTGTIRDIIPEHFVLFMPKDVVSGDFYWFAQMDEAVVVVGADCTGHGVPGALISMLGMTYLDEIVKTNGIVSPAAILDELRERIITALVKEGTENEVRDGMDVVALTIYPSKKELTFAGAKNPLYVVVDGEMVVHKGDRFPVSFSDDIVPFTEHRISVDTRSMVYLFSDGFPDQFGGPSNKKYMYRRFREYLLSISGEQTDVQHKLLRQELDGWMGDISQIDDILVMGIRM